MTNQIYGVIGLGRFGTALTIELAQAGYEVLAIDNDESKVKAVRAYTEHAFVAVDLSVETLRETGVQNCATAIVCIGERIDASILTTLHLKQLGVQNIIAKATTDDQGTILTSLGATVVFPERDMAIRLAGRLTSSNVLENIRLSEDADIAEIRLNGRIAGKSIRGFDFRGRFGLNVLAIVRQGETLIELNPDAPLHDGDILAVVGKKDNIARLEAFLSRGEESKYVRV